MVLSQRLDLRQSQTLVMTPQLQQAIKLLQMSNIELGEYIDREIEQNPLLERDEPGSPAAGGDGADGGGEGPGERGGAEGPEGPEAGAPPLEPSVRDTLDLTSSDRFAEAGDAPLDTDYENVWSHADAHENGIAGGDQLGSWQQGRGSGSGDYGEEGPNLEQTLSGSQSLRDHLIAQFNVDLADPGDRLIALALLDHLDDAGYLIADLDAVASQFECPRGRVDRVLAALQRLDPAGVFARTLAECLAIQLKERNRLDPAMQALLDNLELLAARNLPALIRICGVDAEDITEMVAEIRALNPKPALVFDFAPTQLVTPDILMRVAPGGGWLIDLNPDTLPRVLVNQRYAAQVSTEARQKSERDYVSEKLNSANWLAKSLHQRATTILKVATEIVRQQDAFFRYGIQHLRPLILRDIAEAVGMHESTISRVTTNKFMATPRGIFELKYFFTAAIQSSAGGLSHSAEAVRFRIKALVDAEPADAVLSDDRLVEILRGEGIEIARRTVAKYRESLKIASSVQRRREKSMKI